MRLSRFLELQGAVSHIKRIAGEQEIDDDGDEFNLPDYGVRGCQRAGGAENISNAERFLLQSIKMGDLSFRRGKILAGDGCTA